MHCKLTPEEVQALKPVSDREGDPLRQGDSGFWFFDETWSVLHGPYDSLEAAQENLTAYAETL